MINAGYGIECIKLNPGQEVAAAFFETRRYAAYLGATTEVGLSLHSRWLADGLCGA